MISSKKFIQEFFRRIKLLFSRHDSFNRNVVTLLSGTFFAQIVTVSAAPLITRIYSPELLGLYAFLLSIVIILSSVAAFRYEMAIMLTKRYKETVYVAILSGFLCFIVTLCIMLLLFGANYFELLDKIYLLKVQQYIFFIPALLFITSTLNILIQLNLRMKAYKAVALGCRVQSGTAVGIQVVGGYFKPDMYLLVIGQAAGVLSNLAILLKQIKDKNIYFGKNILKKLYCYAKKYVSFPKYQMPTSFLDVFSIQFTFFLVAFYYPVEFVGYYALADRVLRTPSRLLAGSIGNVFFCEISMYKDDRKKVRNLFFSTMKKLFFLGIFPAFIFYFYAPYFFEVLFGTQWTVAGEITSSLAFLHLVILVISPVSSVFIVYHKQHYSLFFGIALLIGRYLSFYFVQDDILLTFFIYSIQEILLHCLYNVFSYLFISGRL